MIRVKMMTVPLVTLLALSCLSKQEAMKEWATGLALQEEMTVSQEAVVWLRAPSGKLSSFWIKNDVAGVLVVASREGGVVPLDGALWRFPNEDTALDYDWLVLTDLVSGDAISIPLDENAAVPSVDEADGGIVDGGAELAGDTDIEQNDGCVIQSIQALPELLGAIGPYLFVRYNEKQYDCEDRLIISEDRFVAVNLRTRTIAEILSEEELETLTARDEVQALGQDGTVTYMGAVPLYDRAFSPRLSHVFAVHANFVQEDGDRHAVVNSVQIIGQENPAAIVPFSTSPELVQAFAALYPAGIPSGWWPIGERPDVIAKQLKAFLKE